MAPQGTPASVDSSQTIAGLNPEQNPQIFEIYRQKAEDKRAVLAREYAFKLECMRRESEARIAAAAAVPIPPPTATPAAPRRIGEDDDITSEIPQEVQTLTLRFAGLP